MTQADDNLPTDGPRYGCLESHEDAEFAVADRLHPAALVRFRTHLRSCSDCRRMHALMEAIYRGPE